METFKVGDTVSYPPDRGDVGGTGTATIISSNINTTPNGVEYIWVSVKYKSGRTSVWPSNRLKLVSRGVKL